MESSTPEGEAKLRSLRYGSGGWYDRKVSFGPGKHGPEKPDNQAHPSPFPRKQPRLRDRPAAVQGAKRRSEPLTARTDLESSVARERGFKKTKPGDPEI